MDTRQKILCAALLPEDLQRIKSYYPKPVRQISPFDQRQAENKRKISTLNTKGGKLTPHNTIQRNGRLIRIVQDHSGLYRIDRAPANEFLVAIGAPANKF